MTADRVTITKARQWRLTDRICFRPRDKSTNDFLRGLKSQRRSIKINYALRQLLKTTKPTSIPLLYVRRNKEVFENISFQPTPDNARMLHKCRSQRGRIAAVIHAALQLVVPKQ